MSNRKDMRREDLIVRYRPPVPKESKASKAPLTDYKENLNSITPMVAIFLRHKRLGWASLMNTINIWLVEEDDTTDPSKRPLLLVGMSILALFILYLPLFLPSPNAQVPPAPATS